MTAVALALVHAVHAVGGTVTLVGHDLQLEAQEPLSPFLLDSLRQHKPLLLAYLAEQAANGNQPADGPISRPRCRQRQRPRSSLARGRPGADVSGVPVPPMFMGCRETTGFLSIQRD